MFIFVRLRNVYTSNFFDSSLPAITLVPAATLSSEIVRRRLSFVGCMVTKCTCVAEHFGKKSTVRTRVVYKREERREKRKNRNKSKRKHKKNGKRKERKRKEHTE